MIEQPAHLVVIGVVLALGTAVAQPVTAAPLGPPTREISYLKGPVLVADNRGRRHDNEDDDDDDDEVVDAPFANVDARRGRVAVKAPFTSVRVNRRGVWVRVPFVDIYVPK